MLARRSPSETSRRQAIHYATKAIALMKAGGCGRRLDVAAILEPHPHDGRREPKSAMSMAALSRFCGWMVEEGLIEANPCDAFPAASGRSRARRETTSHRSSEFKAVWAAVEDEAPDVRDLVPFLAAYAACRNEAPGSSGARSI